MNKVKILFLAANPTNTSRLKLDEEIRAITEKIRASEHRDLLDVVSVWAVRPDDLLQALNLHKPQIVHFSGHGSGAEGIILHDKNGHAKMVSTKAIKELFKALKDNIQLVVLNACYSRVQAEAITEIIDFVIGMNSTIGDEAAIAFAASFYQAIGFGRSIQEAFNQGRTALLLEGIEEDDIPESIVKAGIGCHAESCVKERESKRISRTDNTGRDCSFGIDRSFTSNPTKEGTIPVSKKKRTTPENAPSMSEQPSLQMPEQQEFHQHLRTLAQSAVRTVLERVMREELDAFIGAAWRECSPKRKGYRNGFYTRDLMTSTGPIEDLNVPRDRAGQFHPQTFERYCRYEPQIAQGLTQMFVAGTSTRYPWGMSLKR